MQTRYEGKLVLMFLLSINKKINIESFQMEVGFGYEENEQVVLIDPKSFEAVNIIIRQLPPPIGK
jgi:hypothetical protein